MTTWLRLAWLNRERIVAAARKLKWPLRVWVALAAFAALVGALYWAYSTGYLLAPTAWPRVQYVLVTINVLGFGLLYLMVRSWFNANELVRDELDQLRSQVDELRVAVHEHEHDIEFTDGGTPEEQPETINALPVSRPPVPPSARPTEVFQAVRAAPVSEREPATVERQLGGRTFQFRSEAAEG